MRGRHIHNRVLVEPLEERFRKAGAHTQCEVAVRLEDRTLYGDLLVEWGSKRILIEAERSSKRIANDLMKAMALRADQLWIVTPNVPVVRSVRRCLDRLRISASEPGLCVLTLGQALERVTGCFPLISRPFTPGKKTKCT